MGNLCNLCGLCGYVKERVRDLEATVHDMQAFLRRRRM